MAPPIRGAYGQGTFFQMLRTAAHTLYSFDGTNGALPYDGLVKGNDGNFYGALSGDGTKHNSATSTK